MELMLIKNGKRLTPIGADVHEEKLYRKLERT